MHKTFLHAGTAGLLFACLILMSIAGSALGVGSTSLPAGVVLPAPAEPPEPTVAVEGNGKAADARLRHAVARGISEMYAITVISPGTEAVDIAKEQVLAHSKRIRVVLSRYFTGDALAWMTESLHDAMQNQADSGVRDVSGGAKLVTITDVQLDGPMAVTVTATAQIWLNTHPAKGAMVEATDIEAVWTYTLHLTKSSDGNWLIDEWTADPEPGSHP